MPAASDAEFERELDRLYQLPANEFTSGRDELAKRLRAEGESEQAEQVKRLRKPTAAVSLANRVARERELDVKRLVNAGQALTAGQAEVAAGQSSQAFLEARREEHDALERLAKAIREIAERDGGLSAVDRATQTLRAASLTEEGRELLKRGRLTEELQPPGLEALTGLPTPPPRQSTTQRPESAAKDERAERRRALEAARARARQLRAEERELVSGARAARREAEQAEAEAARLRERADDAEAEAAAAAARRADADADLERLK